MDTLSNEIILALNNIAETIDTPRPYDWAMFIVTLLSVLSFVVLTIIIYRTNKKQIATQIKIQNSTLRLQVRKEYQDLHSLLLIIKNYPNLLVLDLIILARNFSDKIVKETDDIVDKMNKLKNTQSYLLNENELNHFYSLMSQFVCMKMLVHNIKEVSPLSISSKVLNEQDANKQIEMMDGIIAECNKMESFSIKKFIEHINNCDLDKVTEKYCKIQDPLN